MANSKVQSYFTGLMNIKILLYAVIAGVIGECVMYKKTTQTVTQDLGYWLTFGIAKSYLILTVNMNFGEVHFNKQRHHTNKYYLLFSVYILIQCDVDYNRVLK